jgi:hypothetical protein
MLVDACHVGSLSAWIYNGGVEGGGGADLGGVRGYNVWHLDDVKLLVKRMKVKTRCTHVCQISVWVEGR